MSELCPLNCQPVVYVGSNPEYVISIRRYTIFEDFGPAFSNAAMLPTFFLFHAWPLVIGIVSLFYCGECPSLCSPYYGPPGSLVITVVNIYTFFKRESQCRQTMLSTSGFSRSRYLRLMAISSVEVFGTVPLATLNIVLDAKRGVRPWKSWADTHSHYSAVYQVAGFVWKNVPALATSLEVYRWSLVACSFLFFALFGFAVEAREHYYRLYKLLARCVGYSTSTPHGAQHTCVSTMPVVLVTSLIYWGLNLFFFCQ